MVPNDEAFVLTGAGVTLRELRLSDAPTLFTLLTDEQVSTFISPPPTSAERDERFIAGSIVERPKRRYICLGVVPDGLTAPVGVFQLRCQPGGSNVAEWGVLGSSFWGTGVFAEAARLMLEFAFDEIGVHRLEARASVPNGTGQGALATIGAFHGLQMRESFTRNGQRFDQVMWSILASDWRQTRSDRSEQNTRADASDPDTRTGQTRR